MSKPVLILLAVLCTSCAGQSPEIREFLLRTDASRVQPEPEAATNVGIGIVTVASYIDDLGLVQESHQGTMQTARYNRWAEPLRESLRDFFAREISTAARQAVGTRRLAGDNWKTRIDIYIDQLHGTSDGRAKLVASWSVIDTESRTVLATGELADAEPLDGEGYAALVASQKTLLRQLAAEIAATL